MKRKTGFRLLPGQICSYALKMNKNFFEKSIDFWGQLWYTIDVPREMAHMMQKTREKLERKANRKPPIPYTRRTKTKQEAEENLRKKFGKGIDIWD